MKRAFAVILVVAAATQSSAIRAQADPASPYSQWEHRLHDRVNAELAYPVGASGASGDVFVAFRVGSDGKAVRVATVAMANKTARIAWAIMARGGTYRVPAPRLLAA